MNQIEMTLSEPADLVRAVEMTVAAAKLGPVALEHMTTIVKCAWNKNVMVLDLQPLMDTRILENMPMFHDAPLVTSPEDAAEKLGPLVHEIIESFREGDDRAIDPSKAINTLKFVDALHTMADDLSRVTYHQLCEHFEIDPDHFKAETVPPKEEQH